MFVCQLGNFIFPIAQGCEDFLAVLSHAGRPSFDGSRGFRQADCRLQVFDRAQVFRSRKYVLHLPVVPRERVGKRFGLFLSTAGQDWDYVFDAAIPVVKCFYHVIEVKNRDLSYLMIRSVDEKGAVMSHPTAKEEALSLSRSVLQTMKERLG